MFNLNITQRYIFLIGLVAKIVAGSLLASDFMTDLFIPFVDYFVANSFANPYEKFLAIGSVEKFPYPALMLYIMALPTILLGQIAPGNPFWSLFLFRIPLLIADIGIFLILKSWLDKKFHGRLIWFYWLSPVLFYISYIHGQLDVIPMAFLFLGLFYLFQTRFLPSALFLGCALSTKTHILLVYPFFLLFLLSKNLPCRTVAIFFFLSLGSFVAINTPYILDPSFIQMVFSNQEQDKIFNASVSLGGLTLYLIPASLLILFVRGIFVKRYNRDIFIMFLGFKFSIILLFIAPMQGWYFWPIPFLAYFYIKEIGRTPLIFVALSGFYLLYFLVVEDSDYLKVFQFLSDGTAAYGTFHDRLWLLGFDTEKVVNTASTLLQTALLINCFWVYKRGPESYSRHKITAAPFLIGIGGNSGIGKTTISDSLSSVFTRSNVTVLHGDDMHKWQRGHQKWDHLTHLNPKANHLHKEIDFLKRLKSGKKIYRHHYDHDKGRFTEENVLESNNIIIFEGLHPFYLAAQRSLYDLKIFIKASSDLMYHWKIIRDKTKRGHSKEQIIESIKNRESDSKKYIDTQMDEADILIEISSDSGIQNIGDENENVELNYGLFLSNNVYIDPIIESLEKIDSLDIVHEYQQHDRQCVSLKGTCPKEDLENVAKKHLKALQDLGVDSPTWPKGLLGTVVLFLTYCIFSKAEYERK